MSEFKNHCRECAYWQNPVKTEGCVAKYPSIIGFDIATKEVGECVYTVYIRENGLIGFGDNFGCNSFELKP